MKILHVTEALAGGVLNILALILREQVSAGMDVTLAHSIRPDTPSEAEIAEQLPESARRIVIDMASNISPRRDLLAFARLYSTIARGNYDIIHVHSSKAGFLGRIASLFNRQIDRCFYTPHGFSFLRRDVSSTKRHLFRILEQFAARLGGTTLACSTSEAHHASALFPKNRVRLVENAIFVDQVQIVPYRHRPHCVVATTGRICAQKDPQRFRRIASEVDDTQAQFLWIGGGELEDDLKVGGNFPPNISVTGWIRPPEVAERLHDADVFLMTSLWEGMPLALLEAQIAGLPAVVPNVEGCRDVVVDQVTGFVCNSDEEMKASLSRLISDVSLRQKLGLEARRQGLLRFNPTRMHNELLEAYRSAL